MADAPSKEQQDKKALTQEEIDAAMTDAWLSSEAKTSSAPLNPLIGAGTGAAVSAIAGHAVDSGFSNVEKHRLGLAAQQQALDTQLANAARQSRNSEADQIRHLEESLRRRGGMPAYMGGITGSDALTTRELDPLTQALGQENVGRVTEAARAGERLLPGSRLIATPGSLVVAPEQHYQERNQNVRQDEEAFHRARIRAAEQVRLDRELASIRAGTPITAPSAAGTGKAFLRGVGVPAKAVGRAAIGARGGQNIANAWNEDGNTTGNLLNYVTGGAEVLAGAIPGKAKIIPAAIGAAGELLKKHFNDAAAERKAAGGSVQHFDKGGVAKKAGQELIGRGVDAVMPALQKLFSSGRDINEVKRLFDIAKTDPSRASQEAAGLYHDVGIGKKIKMPVELMTRTVIPNPKEPLAPVKVKNWEDLQGGVGMGGGWDKSGAGLLVDSNGNKFSKPIELQAGQDFIRSHSSLHLPGDSAYGASGPDVITRFSNMAKTAASQKGQDPSKIFHIPLTMTHLGSDFNTMVSDVLLDRLDPSKIPAHLKDLFFADMRSYVPNKKKPDVIPGRYFPHIDDEGAVRAALMAPGAGELRKAFARRSALDQYQNGGFPDVVEARFATSAPELLHTPAGMGGFNIATMDPTGKIISNPRLPHNTYPTQGGGDYFGTLPEGQQLNYKDIYQTWADDRAAQHAADKTKALPKDDWFTFGKQLPTQNFDQQWLDRVKNTLGENRPREWADGGEVEPQGGLDALDRAYA